MDVKQGLSGECVRSGLLVSCEDTENDPRIDAEVSRALGIGSLMAAPIVFDFRVVGLLEVFSQQPRAFTKAHATVLERLVEMIPRSPSEKGQPESAQPEKAQPETPTNPEVVLEVSRPPASELGSNYAAGNGLWQQKPEVAAQLSQKVPEQVPEPVPEPAPARWFQLFHWAPLWLVAAVVATVVGYLVGSMFTKR
ncbi:MAG: GAF domain-containing protein [Terriglobales bacterium]